MTGIQNMIRNYAFSHDCDFDEATYKVMQKVLQEAQMKRDVEGLYDRLFGEDKKNGTGGKGT